VTTLGKLYRTDLEIFRFSLDLWVILDQRDL
jgi:hypothetical protein